MKIKVVLLFNGDEETLEAINACLCNSIRKDFIDGENESVELWSAEVERDDEEDGNEEE